MSLVFNGISEGTFAFYIIFCTLVGMATGAYLMDRDKFVMILRSKAEKFLSDKALLVEKPTNSKDGHNDEA